MANIFVKRTVNVDLAGYEIEALKTTRAIIKNLQLFLQDEEYPDLVTLTGLALNDTYLGYSFDIITAILEESEFEIEE